MTNIPQWKDKILFTPGPLTTSRTVKQAMLKDLGSRDFEFIKIVKEIRQKLLEIAEVADNEYETILMQGSGTFSIEAVLSSTVPPDGKVLLIINGSYGKRMAHICEVLNIQTQLLSYPENTNPDLTKIDRILSEDADITNIAVVHCETTTGIINPIEELGLLAKQYQKSYFVDAMSSFGAVPININQCHIDFLVSSANKCIEGVPGFAFIIAKKSSLLDTEGYARSVSFNILAQWQGLEKNGQFRFTPPTHSLIAFHQALLEFEQEGGVTGRANRYRHNYQTLVQGMRQMGFREYLHPDKQGYIITSFLYPDHANFDFQLFYETLNNKNYVIYPGKLSEANSFRIGNIGRIFASDVQDLLAAVKQTLKDMSVNLS